MSDLGGLENQKIAGIKDGEVIDPVLPYTSNASAESRISMPTIDIKDLDESCENFGEIEDLSEESAFGSEASVNSPCEEVCKKEFDVVAHNQMMEEREVVIFSRYWVNLDDLSMILEYKEYFQHVIGVYMKVSKFYSKSQFPELWLYGTETNQRAFQHCVEEELKILIVRNSEL